MISLPDELLERLDDHAHRSGETRSGLLQQLAAEYLRRDDEDRLRHVDALLSRAGSHGGESTAAVREFRDSR